MLTPLKLKVKDEEGKLSSAGVQKKAKSLKKEGTDGEKIEVFGL